MKQLLTLLPYLRPYRRAVFFGLVLVVVSNVFAVWTPDLVGRAIDTLRQPGATRAGLLRYAGLIVGVAVLGGIGRFGMRQLLNGYSRRVENDLRHALFDHLMRLDAGFYGRSRTGDLMSRATNDTQLVRMAVGPAVMYLVNTVVASVLTLAVMMRISPVLTGLSVVPLALLPPAMIFFGRRIHRQSEAIQEHFGTLSTLAQENLAGVRIVRAYRQEAQQAEEFDALNREYLARNMALAHTSGVFSPLLTFLAGLGAVIVVWVGGREAMAGRISVGDFVEFAMYLAMLTWPMIALGWVINLFQRGAASVGRLNAILGTPPAIQGPATPARPAVLRGEIEFRDVTFRYPGTERDVLHHVSFRVPAGQTAALVGPTGSGKSTVAALIDRLHDPTGGTVLLDGVPLPEFSLEQLRGAIGVVPQEAFVFSESIAENIAFGLPPGASRERAVKEAARVAQLDETVSAFPAGYATRLGERGVNLSGGQRQRTTLARAIARDPRVLILDDALSAVDTHTETRILQGLRRVLKDRTALIVSHRVTAVMNADLILVMEDGRIVERGTHAELLARKGLYATLLRRQILEEGLDEGEPLAAASGEV
ncbi:MAG TPA: ABC transporter ATP-binding protein [Longimicrobiales bacterium]|nr:ABC transporter ATP-binding protein [Longimicrobiales bacterium]